MSVSLRKKIGILLGLFSVITLALAYVFWQKAQQSSPQESPKPAAAEPAQESPATAATDIPAEEEAADEGETTETAEGICNSQNTFGDGDKKNRSVSPDLQFKASVFTGDPVTYSLPFALKPGQSIAFTYEVEGFIGETARCVTDGSSLRCAEVFYSHHDNYCGPVKLADGTEKFVQFFLDIKDKPAPLPSDLDKYAVKKETRALGVFEEKSFRQEERTSFH